MRYLFFSVLFLACGTTSNVTCPPPSVSYDTVRITKYDTITHEDTTTQTIMITKVIRDTVLAALNVDTADRTIVLYPIPGGDDYPQLQAAINYEQSHGGIHLFLTVGVFHISHPLIAASIVNGQYQDAYLYIEGASNAKNPIQGQISQIVCTFDNGFGIGYEMCKGCTIKNLFITGQYTLPNNLTPFQIDMLPASAWQDGVHSFNRSAPYAGIAADFASDSNDYVQASPGYPADSMYQGLHQYSITGMGTSGSTAVNITGCFIANFVVGIVNSPAYQLNGELLNFNDNQLSYDFVGYAFTQAQAKMNLVRDLECWGQVYCLFDGNRFGIGHGDGSICPIVDGVNIAGTVNELIDHNAASFAVHLNNVYAEGLFRLGALNAAQGANFENFNVDFQQDGLPTVPLVPSPGEFFTGNGVTFTNCAFRIYDGNGWYNNLTMFGFGLVFMRGAMGAPIIGGYETQGPLAPIFWNVPGFYVAGPTTGTGTPWNTYLNLGSQQLTINRTNNTGYVTHVTDTSVTVGDVLITTYWTNDYYPTLVDNWEVGSVSNISGDTAYISHVGVSLKDTVYAIWDVKNHL